METEGWPRFGEEGHAPLQASAIVLRQQRHGPSKRLIDEIISASNFGFHPQAATFPKSIAQWESAGQSSCKEKGETTFFVTTHESGFGWEKK